MKPDLRILDANLRALLQRSYQPVVIRPLFERQLRRELVQRAADLAAVRPQRRATHPAVWRWAAAAAALIAALGVWWWPAPTGGTAAESLAALLERGASARREDSSDLWREVDSSLVYRGGSLELATAPGGSVEVLVAGRDADDAGGRIELGGRSRARLSAEFSDDGPRELEVHLEQGALRAARAKPDLGSSEEAWRVSNGQGALALEQGTLGVAYQDPPSFVRPLDPESGARGSRSLPESILPNGGWVRLTADAVEPASWSLEGTGGAALPEELFLAAGVPYVDGGDLGNATARTPVPERESAQEQSEQSATDAPALLARLLAPDGSDLETISVALLPDDDEPYDIVPLDFFYEQAGGRFEIESLAPNDYEVYVQVSGFALAHAGVHRLGEGPVELDIELEVGGELRGIVLDRDTGQPLAGVRVLSETDSATRLLPTTERDLVGILGARTFTQPDGRFVLRNLSSREHVVRAQHAEWAPAWTEPLRARAAKADGATPTGPEIELRLGRGGAVAGYAEGADGVPLAGASVVLTQATELFTEPRVLVEVTGSELSGEFAFPHVAPGDYVVVLNPVNDGEAEIRFASVVDGKTSRVDFRGAGVGLKVAGRLLDSDGNPMSGRGVSLVPSGDPQRSSTWRTGVLDQEGRFVFEDLTAGDYDLYVSVGRPMDVVAVSSVRVEPPGVWERDYRMAGAKVSGRVVRADGAPEAGLTSVVAVRYDDSGDGQDFVAKLFTEADGSFEIPYLPEGLYRFGAMGVRGEYAVALSEDTWIAHGSETTGVELHLAPGAGLELTVRDPDGNPLQGVRLERFDTATPFWYTERPWTDPGGRMTLSGLPTGSLTFELRHTGYLPFEGSGLFEDSRALELDVTMQPDPAASAASDESGER